MILKTEEEGDEETTKFPEWNFLICNAIVLNVKKHRNNQLNLKIVASNHTSLMILKLIADHME